MIIDIHAHIWRGRYESNKAEIIKACNLYGISKVYISGLDSQYPDEAEIMELNNEVHRFMQEQPELIGGFCYVSPRHPTALYTLQKCVEEMGMSGLKLWIATFCDDPSVFQIVEKCISYDIPILVHSFYKSNGNLTDETTGLNTVNLAKRYPEAKIIMAHLGGNCYHGIKAVKHHKNIWVDISGSPFRRDDVDYTVEQLGAERILFGTDMPGSYLVNAGQIEEAQLSLEQKDMIYYLNAKRILRLE
jgi:uncharacterized protein